MASGIVHSFVSTPRTFDPKTSTLQQDHERVLKELALAGDCDAFYQLVQPHERSIFRAALLMMGDEARAEQVCMEAVEQVFIWIKKQRWQPVRAWLIESVVLECIRQFDKAGVRARGTDMLDSASDLQPGVVAGRIEMMRGTIRRALVAAMHTMPIACRAVAVLHDAEGFSIDATAAALSISMRTAKSRLRQARFCLNDAMERWERSGSVYGEQHQVVTKSRSSFLEQVIGFVDRY